MQSIARACRGAPARGSTRRPDEQVAFSRTCMRHDRTGALRQAGADDPPLLIMPPGSISGTPTRGVRERPRSDRNRPLETLIFDMAQQRPECLSHVVVHRVGVEFCQQPNRKRRRRFTPVYALCERPAAAPV